MRAAGRTGRAADYLEVRVPRPVVDDTIGGMLITTEDREVSVQCGRHWHAHFSEDSRPTSPAFGRALYFAARHAS